jgi:type IV pilus assembly protein PilV
MLTQNTNMTLFPARVPCRGFTLLEVLIAVLLLSVGLLGIAGLQLLSKQSNFEALQRTTASMLAQDIIERMRGNPTALATYVASGGKLGEGETPLSATNCTTSKCLPAQLALYDLYEWQEAILGAAEKSGSNDTGGLVSPTACITGPAPGTYNIAVAWRGQTALTASATVLAEPCGAGKYGTNDEYRRILVITTYIGG